MGARLYTLEEARALLPEVIPLLERLRSAMQRMRALEAAVAVDARGASGDGNLITTPWEHTGGGENLADILSRQVRGAMGQLELWGIELKDPQKGLIDFQHERDGEVVYLCYQLGEPDIEWWHTLSGGFAGRQKL
jgi:hypothetical protein